MQVIVVDNHSNDDTVKKIKQDFKKVELIELAKNEGFATANNIGLQKVKGKFVLFLNPDTEVQEGALDDLAQYLSKSPEGIVAPLLLNPDKSVQIQGGSLPNFWRVMKWMFFLDKLPILNMLEMPYQSRSINLSKKVIQMGWISGAAVCMPTSLTKRLGGWDANMFMYGEDVELCMRANLQHVPVHLLTYATVIHHQNKSTGSSSRAILGEMDGLQYIWQKHFPGWQMPVLKLVLWIGCWLRILIFGILKADSFKRKLYFDAQKRIFLA